MNVTCDWRIREARAADAGTLRELMERTFRATYGHLAEAEDMELHVAEAFAEDVQLREICDTQMKTLLMESGDELIGFAQVRTGTTAECVRGERPVELWRIYLEKTWQGRGAARLLMAEAKAVARAWDGKTMWLGVWELNPRAMRFYRKCGFKVCGEHTFRFGREDQVDLVMTCEL
ncbi:MAG TPA: GNAT family N-acetyltransferase [Phycisphaerales bacterium]|nr:GNAT family N-acetyltransferase [Phycisphaerales bacterium]